MPAFTGFDPKTLKFLKELGAEIKIRKLENGNYFRTDQENYILDCHFGPIEYPEKLDQKLNLRAGIMEHGLFLSMANDVVMATEQEVKHLVRDF